MKKSLCLLIEELLRLEYWNIILLQDCSFLAIEEAFPNLVLAFLLMLRRAHRLHMIVGELDPQEARKLHFCRVRVRHTLVELV